MLKKLLHRFKINRSYVSPIDIKLREFDQSHGMSDSQADEIAKYHSIYYKRDVPTPEKQKNSKIWQDF